MAKTSWKIKVGDKQHIVELQTDSFFGFGGGSGRVLVDGEVAKAWGSSLVRAMPKRIVFELEGKEVVIKGRGMFNSVPVLLFDDRKIESL